MRSRAGNQARRLRAMTMMRNEKSPERTAVPGIGSLILSPKATESEVLFRSMSSKPIDSPYVCIDLKHILLQVYM